MRPGDHVRQASASDLDGLVGLCLQARAESGVGRQLCSDEPERLREQLAVLSELPGGVVLLATSDGEPAGLALGRVLGSSLLPGTTVLSLDAVYVRPASRRHGLGHALLQAVAATAEAAGAADVYAAPLPGSRGMQRFLARAGFAPAAAHRVVSTSALQRRLAMDAPTAVRRPGHRGIEDLIARRRRARASIVTDDDARQAGASISMHVSRAVHSRRASASSTTTS